MLKRLVVVGSGILLVGVAVLALMPAKIEPHAFAAPPARALEGPLAKNEALLAAEVLSTDGLVGPEDLLVEDGPRVTAGMQSGEVWEWTPKGARTLANTGGRPLGLARDATGRLLIADADRGLLRLEPDGKVTSLASTCDGRPFRFTNELAVASDGSVYFSDSSDRWPIRDFPYEVLEGRARGRILRWEPGGQVKCVLDHLHFPNGVVLAQDESALYFSQSTRYQVTKLHLKGPKAGQVEPLVDDLPGFPDNLSMSPRGTIWVALFSLRDPLLDLISPHAWARGLIAKLPRPLWDIPHRYGILLEVSTDGKILRSMQDPGATHFPEVTTAVERDGSLWLGTLRSPRFARLKL